MVVLSSHLMRPVVLAGMAVALFVACRRNEKPAHPVDPQKVLAIVDDSVITVAHIERQIHKQPPHARARYSSPQLRKELLDNLVRFEVMAREAEKRGYGKDPDVLAAIKQQMVSQMVRREVDTQKADDVPEADAKKYYEEHPVEFNRDEEVRVSHILVKDKTKAIKVLGEVQTLYPFDENGFRHLVAKYSQDEPSKPRGGDLLFFDRKTSMQPRAVVEAAFAIKDVNGLSPLVESEKGFHILKLTQKRAAVTKPFADVKGEIQRRLFEERRSKRLEAWVGEVRKQQKVEVFEERLKSVRLDPPPPGTQPAAPVQAAAVLDR